MQADIVNSADLSMNTGSMHQSGNQLALRRPESPRGQERFTDIYHTVGSCFEGLHPLHDIAQLTQMAEKNFTETPNDVDVDAKTEFEIPEVADRDSDVEQLVRRVVSFCSTSHLHLWE